MINPGEWGYTNPVISGLYGKPPLRWRDMRVQVVVYEADIEQIRRVIPHPLEPRSNIVIVWASEFTLGTTQGAFRETAIYVQVTFNGMEGDYEPFLYVNSHIPLTAGREIWGFQKKLADIDLRHEHEAVVSRTTRLGQDIIKTIVVPEADAAMGEIPWSRDGVYSLKYIPSAQDGEPPLRQLILTRGAFSAQEGRLFSGRASVAFERSEIDPTYLLEPKRILRGYHGQGDLFLPLGTIVYRYDEGQDE
ncbi:MAG: acetoacetate decarboxylase family protein [Devosia sp.]